MEKRQLNGVKRGPWGAIGMSLAVVALIGLLLMMMPKGFKATHEQIGQGTPAVVFVYDPNLTVSGTQTEQMNEARGHLGDKVLFLLARVGTPEGDQMINKYRAGAAELLLFDGSGKLVKRQLAVQDANQLMRWVR